MMARARNIKHGLYLNEELAELSIHARYLFPCLWCLADKNGRMEYRPKKIKAEAYPYDDVDIPGLLMELHEKKFISVYGHGTRAYIQVHNWEKHQSPHPKEKPSPLPAIDDPVSIVACVGFNDDQEKQFLFTAEPRPDREKPHRTSDSLPSDVRIVDSSPSDVEPTNEKPKMMTMKEFEDCYIKTFGKTMSGMLNYDMEQACRKYPRDVLLDAFRITAEHSGDSWSYTKKVLTGTLNKPHRHGTKPASESVTAADICPALKGAR